MIKNIFASAYAAVVVASALIFGSGCGGAPEDFEGGTNDGEIGTAEEPLSVNSSKYGISTASSHITCRSDGSTGQDCLVPTSKTIQYCLSNAGGTWSDAELNNVRPVITNPNFVLQSFTFQEVNVGQQTNCKNNGAALKIQKGTCSGGSTAGNVEAFVCYAPAIVAGAAGQLTESLPGQWRKMLGGTVTVDTADIAARTAAHADGNCVQGHGLRHSLAASAGIGQDTTQADTFGTLVTSRQIEPTFFDGGPLVGKSCVHTSFTSQEQCFANSVNPGGGGGGGFMAFNSTVCN